MSSFNVFLKGIHPNRVDEKDKIIQDASQYLSITVEELSEKLSVPGSYCLLQGVSEEEAKDCQISLAKLGLISVYKPGKNLSTLTLQPSKIKHDSESFNTLNCPICNYDISFPNNQVGLIKCNSCGREINIEKYLLAQQQKHDRDEIKANLLRSQNARINLDNKTKQDEAKKKYLEELEKDVLKEIQNEQQNKPSRAIVIATSIVLVIATGGLTYIGSTRFFSATQSQASTSTSDNSKTPDKTFKPQVVEAQGSLQQTHDQAEKVLNSFGLSSDNIANGSSSTSASAPDEEGNLKQASDSLEDSATQQADISTAINFEFINNIGHQEWDLFLSKTITHLANHKDLPKAILLTSHINDTKVYVDTIGQLLLAAKNTQQLNTTNTILSKLENRIIPLPAVLQAKFFAQAGWYQKQVTESNKFLEHAAKIAESLDSPEDQLEAVLVIALYNYKAGNTQVANQYFGKINDLLKMVSSKEQQVLLRTMIARTYNDTGNNLLAIQWIDSARKQSTSQSPKELIDSYAYANQAATAISLIKQIQSTETQDQFIYEATKAALQGGSIEAAVILTETMQNSFNKALAYALNADYEVNSDVNLTNAFAKELPLIQDAAQKAIISSLLARHYTWIKDSSKATELSQAAMQQLEKIPASLVKDQALAIIVKNYAYSLRWDDAQNLLSLIQTPLLKDQTNKEITELATIREFLS